MNARFQSTLLFLFAVLALTALPFAGCDCGDDDDDDDSGPSSKNCAEEKACYDEIDDCYNAAETLVKLLECTGDGVACLTGAGSCTTDYFDCLSGCNTDTGCIDTCIGSYKSCFSGCGWDYECFDDCSVEMDTCTEDCPLSDMDCWKACYTDGYGACMDGCF